MAFVVFFLFHIVIYMGLRAQFLVWNWPALKDLTGSELFLAFLHGVRFDLSVLAITVGLLLLGDFWLWQRPKLQKIWFSGWVTINAAFLLLNLVDSELINFTARRFTYSSLFLWKEAHVSNLVAPYLGMAIFSLFLLSIYFIGAALFFRYHQRVLQSQLSLSSSLSFKRQYSVQSILQKIGFTVVIFLLMVLLNRGGLQTKPLTYVDAKIFNHTFANNLVLNSTFTFFKSFTKTSLPKVHYFDRQKMLALLNAQDISSTRLSATTIKSSNLSDLQPKQSVNVVIILLESFSQEYTQLKNPERTPFLNRLRQKSVDFTKAYANGRRSIEGVAALLSGIPALMEEPFINSEFSANQVIGLGTLLKEQHYHTSFFHGAQNGSMHFDQFAQSIGIQNYFGKNEYPNTGDDDGTWGVYDEPFLQWICQKFNEFPQPFLSSVFTLTSHQPFKIPAAYQDRFTEGVLPILKAVSYTDYALEKFMACAEKQKWYSNTLFIITADHTGPPLDQAASFASRFQVPLLFFSPQSQILNGLESNQWAQHIDVLPTLLETLGFEQKNKNYLARSLWRRGDKIIALYADQHYELVGEVKNASQQLQAIQQYFSEGLYDNRLYYPSK